MEAYKEDILVLAKLQLYMCKSSVGQNRLGGGGGRGAVKKEVNY